MLGFDAKLVSGVTVAAFPADPRRNLLRGRAACRNVGAVGHEIVCHAFVDGAETPDDLHVDGYTFTSDIGEWPPSRAAPPATRTVSLQSSIQKFTPDAPGWYSWAIRRRAHGGMIFHVHVLP